MLKKERPKTEDRSMPKSRFLLLPLLLVGLLTSSSARIEASDLNACFEWACTCSGVCSFDARCSTGPITTYAWTFADGGFGGGAVTQHIYAQPGDYSVTLWVSYGKPREGTWHGDSVVHTVHVGCN